MDPARQIIRWSIPGALSIFTSCIVFVALHLPVNDNVADALRPISENVAPAAAVALSVPLGFLWFHVYDLLYHPRRRMPGFLPTNAGAKVLQFLTEEQRTMVERATPGLLVVPLHRVLEKGDVATIGRLPEGPALISRSFTSPELEPIGWLGSYLSRMRVVVDSETETQGWRARRRERRDTRRALTRLYKERWRTHYDLAAVLVDISAFGEHSAKLKDQWRGAYDIFHSLGATRYAIIGGLLGGLSLYGFEQHKAKGPIPERYEVYAIGGVLVLLCVLGVVGLNRARGRRLDTSTQRLGYSLRVVLAREPELLEQLRDLPADHQLGLPIETEADRRAILAKLESFRLPRTFVWSRYHHATGAAGTWFADSALTEETAAEALAALPPDAFGQALTAVQLDWLMTSPVAS